MLPFSNSSPPTIPNSASAIPPSVARSGREPALFGLVGAAACGATLEDCFAAVAVDSAMALFGILEWLARGIRLHGFPRPAVGRIENAPTEIDDPLNHFVGAFPYAKNLPRRQGNHRVRSYVNVLNEIGIEHHRNAIQASQPDHSGSWKLIGEMPGKP